MDFTSVKDSLDIKSIKQIADTLPKDAGLLAHILANVWLLVPFITFLLFKMISMHLTGSLILYMQFLYVIITIGLSFYFVDKNAHKSKFSAILSSLHNSLILFSILLICINYNPCATCIATSSLHMANFTILLIVFNVLVAMSNKNGSSESNIFILLGIIIFHCLRIHFNK